MPIIIVDNGQAYSDHQIYFLTGTRDECAFISELVELHNQTTAGKPGTDGIVRRTAEKFSVILMADTVTWFQGEPIPAARVYEVVGWKCPKCGAWNNRYNSQCWSDCDGKRPTWPFQRTT